MPWDMIRCINGAPAGFTDADATNLVNGANFANSVYVNTSEETGAARHAYTYVQFGGMTLCVTGVIHLDPATGQYSGPGICFIPGWNAWAMRTPVAQCAAINALPDGGVFPGANRYPH